MKRMSFRRKMWHLRRAASEARKHQQKNLALLTRRIRLAGFVSVTAPRVINIQNPPHRKNLVYFIQSIKDKLKAGKRKIFCDFVPVEQFYSGGSLWLLAELQRLKVVCPDVIFRSSCPRRSKAAQVMKQTGLAKILRTSVKAKVRDHDVVHWKFATGQGVFGEKCDAILGPYDGVIAEALSDQLYRGMTEAMTNANHHAYIDQRGDGFDTGSDYKPWWMFSQERDGYLNVVFCDLGLGIPATLPLKQPRWWMYAERFGITEKGEGTLIQGAVRNSQSRTRLLHRGKGLRQIVDTVRSVGGVVYIFSNHGFYSMDCDKECVSDFRDSIQGTVIQWRMPLPQQKSVKHENS